MSRMVRYSASLCCVVMLSCGSGDPTPPVYIALKELGEVIDAEHVAYRQNGSFLPLENLGPSGLKLIKQDLSSGSFQNHTGFNGKIELAVNNSNYSVRLDMYDLSGSFVLSAFTDSTCVIRVETQRKASATSEPFTKLDRPACMKSR
jgi:hypothetical protein